MESDQALNLASRIGFPMIMNVDDRDHIAPIIDDFRAHNPDDWPPGYSPKYPYSGIYMFFHYDGTMYIGQSRDVDLRYYQEQSKWDVEIDYVAYLYTPVDELKETKIEIIKRAVKFRYPITNTEFVTPQLQDFANPFDEIVSPIEQHEYLFKVKRRAKREEALDETEAMLSESELAAWNTFNSVLKGWGFCSIDLMRLYIERVIPQPMETVDEFWHVSLPEPMDNADEHEIVSITCGDFKTFVLFYYENCPDRFFVRIAITDVNFLEEYDSLSDVEEDYDWAKFSFKTSRKLQDEDEVWPFEVVDTENLSYIEIPLNMSVWTLNDSDVLMSALLVVLACMREQTQEGSVSHPLLRETLFENCDLPRMLR